MRRTTLLFAVMAICATSLVQAQQPINALNHANSFLPNNGCLTTIGTTNGLIQVAVPNFGCQPRIVQNCTPQIYFQPSPCDWRVAPIMNCPHGMQMQTSLGTYGPYAQQTQWMVQPNQMIQPNSIMPTDVVQPAVVAGKAPQDPTKESLTAENGTKSTKTKMMKKLGTLCPRKHLFSTINMHYYSTIDCPTGNPSNVTFGYKHHPTCGCNGMAPPPCNDNTPPTVQFGGDLAAGALPIEELKRMAEAKEAEMGFNLVPDDSKVPTPVLDPPTEDLD